MDTLLFASLMGLYYWFARLRLYLLRHAVTASGGGGSLSACCSADMPAAMIIGAGMQLVYLGVT